MPDPFIDIDDLAAYRKRSMDQADALGLMAIAAACDEIRRVAEQSLDYAEEEDVALDSLGTDTILLPELPVHDVTLFVGPGGIELEEGVDYVLDREMGALCTKRFGRRWLPGRQAYTVDYSHGYLDASESGLEDVPLFPPALKALAVTVASRFYDQQGVSQESVGGYQAIYGSPEALTLTARERSLLEKILGPGRRR